MYSGISALVIFKYVGDGIGDVRREAIDIYDHI
jgi:hypothetical protein